MIQTLGLRKMSFRLSMRPYKTKIVLSCTIIAILYFSAYILRSRNLMIGLNGGKYEIRMIVIKSPFEEIFFAPPRQFEIFLYDRFSFQFRPPYNR